MNIITLLTDFGLKDGNVGVMKGVIWGINSQAKIADISHNISPQNIREASLILLRSAVYFPHGTIHMVVVDPGVGTERRPIAAQVGPYYFVGPDNGVITMLFEEANKKGWEVRFVHTDDPNYWLAEISNVFHGRDIFAPVAAYLSRGVPLEKMGSPINDYSLINLQKPVRLERIIRGEVIHIDHFGNLSTNIREEHIDYRQKFNVSIGEHVIDGIVKTFGERELGELIALYGSTGNLILSVVNGNAAEYLGADVGDAVTIEFID